MNREPTRSAGSRVAVSIISVFGLASFLLLLAAFWSGSFSRFQDFTVVAVAFLVFTAANGALWASWGTPLPRSATGPGSPAGEPDFSTRRAREETGP